VSSLIDADVQEAGRQMIRDGQVVEDTWHMLENPDALDDLPKNAAVCVPMARWNTERERLLQHGGALGVCLAPHDDPEALTQDIHRFALVAIGFPTFNDGRGYSIARILRQRLGFRGELRAVGDVLRDQLFYMARCGFNAFVLAPGRDLHAALASLGEFSNAYQSAADRPLPLFRHRLETRGSVRT